MKVFNGKENIYVAVDIFVKNGFVIIDGTKTIAESFANRLIKCLEPYTLTSPQIGYKDVTYNGYYYYVVDYERINPNDTSFLNFIDNIDKENEH